MIFFAALLLAAAASTAPGPASLAVDLDGDGRVETVRARASGSSVRIEVADAAGRRRARTSAASPGRGAAVALSSGPLGEGGSLLEVSAIGPQRECRTFWRLRGEKLESLPLVGPKGRLPDCSGVEGWTDRWSRPSPDAPADYLRERTRATPRGDFHRTECFRFSGFELRYEPARSRAEIGGLVIPDVAPVLLYPRSLIEALHSCFDLSGFKTAARLRIVTDPDEGVFDAVLESRDDRKNFPITAVVPRAERGEFVWTVGSGDEAAQLNVRFGSDERTPIEIASQGHGREWNMLYAVAGRMTSRGLEVFPTAEDELAAWSLAGGWDSLKGHPIQVRLLSTSPAVLEFDKQRVAVSITDAPAGADVLLVPSDGSLPRTALRLRGQNLFNLLSVECAAGPASCRVASTGEEFRRQGTSMNAR